MSPSNRASMSVMACPPAPTDEGRGANRDVSKRRLSPLPGLELQILVGGQVEPGDAAGDDVLHARAHADGEAEVIDGREERLVVDELLDLVEHRLALLLVELALLALEEVVDLRPRAGGG